MFYVVLEAGILLESGDIAGAARCRRGITAGRPDAWADGSPVPRPSSRACRSSPTSKVDALTTLQGRPDDRTTLWHWVCERWERLARTRLAAARGDGDSALEHAQALQRLASNTDDAGFTVLALLAEADAELTSARSPRAEELVRRARTLWARKGPRAARRAHAESPRATLTSRAASPRASRTRRAATGRRPPNALRDRKSVV